MASMLSEPLLYNNDGAAALRRESHSAYTPPDATNQQDNDDNVSAAVADYDDTLITPFVDPHLSSAISAAAPASSASSASNSWQHFSARLFLFYCCAVAVTAIVIYILTPSTHCNESLQTYIMSLAVTSTILSVLSAYALVIMPSTWSELAVSGNAAEACRWMSVALLKQVISVVDFAFFIYGNVAISNAYSCSSTSLLIFRYSALILALSYIGIIFPIGVFVYVTYHYGDYIFRQQTAQDRERALIRPARKSEIDACPMTVYEAGTSELAFRHGLPMCVICYTDYTDGVRLRTLPCHHHFHLSCVDSWLNIRNCCPICKHRINAKPLPIPLPLVSTTSPSSSSADDATRVAASEVVFAAGLETLVAPSASSNAGVNLAAAMVNPTVASSVHVLRTSARAAAVLAAMARANADKVERQNAQRDTSTDKSTEITVIASSV